VLAELCAQLFLQPRQTDLTLCQTCLGAGNREKAAESQRDCHHDDEAPGSMRALPAAFDDLERALARRQVAADHRPAQPHLRGGQGH
jgi:hypothetical protein